MPKVVLLDSGPLGMVSHPRMNPAVAQWLKNLLARGVTVLVPEIADYEVRRELLRAKQATGVQRLDQLKQTLGYVPLTTDAMLKAAEFWASARNRGKHTAKDEALDGDMILAAQAATLDDDDALIATTNVKHLADFVEAEVWNNIK